MVTFLFAGAGVDDSSRLWSDLATDVTDEWRAHEAIVRGAIEQSGGYVFGTGDEGVRAAFETPGDAVTAAIAAQEQLRDDLAAGFAIGMGLHTAASDERDGNYVGAEVNRTARLTSLAHCGQVLVSDTTEVLLRDRVALRPLGEHRLRGVRGRMSVYQVVVDGLPSEFGELRSAGEGAGNLAQPLNSLVGRESAVAEIAELVRSNRLVTLSGVGGVGKTRLALEVGPEVADDFLDGVWMVDLSAVADAASIPSAIATTLGITPQGDAPLIDTVADALNSRHILLVLDNCEHVVVAAASAVATIVTRSRSTKVLATSRERLAVEGETMFSVVPLAVDGGELSDAAALFVDRARAARPAFALSDRPTAAAVTEICETLDGLPLGIELAAARMAVMSAVEVKDRLADRPECCSGRHRVPNGT
jgi:class 3 adenylate cyclase